MRLLLTFLVGDRGPKPSKTPYPISIGGPYPTTFSIDIPPIPTISIPEISIPPIPSISIPDINIHYKREVEVESKKEGTIKVSSVDGSLDGYLSAPNEEGLYGFTTDRAAAVKFAYSPFDEAPFAIKGETTESEVSRIQLCAGGSA